MSRSIKFITILFGLALGASMPSMAAQNLGPTLSKIADKGTITIGYRESARPFAYIGDDGKPAGFSIDICHRIVQNIKDKLDNDDLDIKYVPETPETRIPLIANGTLDMECGSTTNTLSRQEQVDFSYTTFVTGTRLLTKKDSDIEGLDDLVGHRVGVAPGTTNEKAIMEAIDERGLEDIKISHYSDHAKGFLALHSGRIDAYSTDDILLFGLISKSDNPDEYEVVGDYLSYDPYAIMLPQDDSQFRLLVNKTLVDLFRSGDIEDIYAKWFDPMGVPLSDNLAQLYKFETFPE